MFFNRTTLPLDDKVVVITGAGSGMGRALADLLTHKGAHVAISDWNSDALAETARQIEGRGTKVMSASFDVSDRAAFEAHAAEVIAELGRVDVVINNAGVSLAAPVAAMTYADFEWVMGIDFWGVVHGTKAFLPHMLERGDGAIVNVSSVFGLFGVPTQAGYNSAKFAVRGFTEALQQEVAGTGVHVARVHPGGVKTGIVRNGRIHETMDDGEIIVRGIERRRPRILVGPDAKVMDWLVRIFPVRYQKLMGLINRVAGAND
jgi:NAD(P)-dependent dehydrogenase (short-subunit alcohol dehydrogenase family)